MPSIFEGDRRFREAQKQNDRERERLNIENGGSGFHRPGERSRTLYENGSGENGADISRYGEREKNDDNTWDSRP